LNSPRLSRLPKSSIDTAMALGRHCERVRFDKVRLMKKRKGAKSEKMEFVPASSAYMLANGQQEARRPRALAPSALARVGAGTTATATAIAACNVQRVIGSALWSEVCGGGRGAEGRRESQRKRKRKDEAVAVANGQGAGAQEGGKKAGPLVTRSEREAERCVSSTVFVVSRKVYRSSEVIA
jgi:hypothetical protein